MSSTCVLCLGTRKLKGSEFINICSVEVAEKISQAYEDINRCSLPREILNQRAHKKCYGNYHRHYKQMIEKRQSSTKVAKRSLIRRSPLTDCTNTQAPPSVQATKSISQYSTEDFSQLSCNIGGVIGLSKNRCNSASVTDPTFSLPMQSSIVKQINSNESSKAPIESPTSRKKIEFYDLVEMINRNGSSSNVDQDFQSTSSDDKLYSQHSHSEATYNAVDVVHPQQDFPHSSGFTDLTYSSSPGSTGTKCSSPSGFTGPKYSSPSRFRSSPIEGSFVTPSPIEISSITLPVNRSSFLSPLPNEPTFISSPVNQSSFIPSSPDKNSFISSSPVKNSFNPSSPIEDSFIPSSSVKNLFNPSSPIEDSYIPLPINQWALISSPSNKSSLVSSPSNQSSLVSSPSIQLSSIQPTNPEKSLKTRIKSSTARKKIDFNQFIDVNDASGSSPETNKTKSISSRLRSRYPTRIRRKTTNSIQYPIDDKTKSSLYSDSFSELCGWLRSMLRGGVLVSLISVKEKYEEILKSRNEMITEGIIRTSSIRDRLHTKFKNRIFFTKLNNRQGVFVSWNDLLTITESTLAKSLTANDSCTFQSTNIYKGSETAVDKEAQSKTILEAIELIRNLIRENMHYLKLINNETHSLAEFTSGLFWDCIPTPFKNIIGLLTATDDNFQDFKNTSSYSNIFNQDIYKSTEKSLKISSIAYDIINARYDTYSTPKHLLLGNELFHHVRSSHLLNIMNRFGHTCSYETIIRLQKKVATDISKLSSTDLPPTVRDQHSFAIIVADNFDMNIGSLHGEDSIHILNRIIVQSPLNNEIKFDVNGCINDLCDSVVSAVDSLNIGLLLNSDGINSTTPAVSKGTKEKKSYTPYKDNSYRHILLAYGLMKHCFDTNNIVEKILDNRPQAHVPLLAGFFSTYVPNEHRPLSKITFLPPIDQNPSSLTTSQLCLKSAKASLIDSHYQQEAIVVVDEKIYSNCIKAKRLDELENKSIFLYAGDFHVMKNFMVVIWDVLDGSGLDDILGCIYKAAAHRAVLNVYNFNYSLRCCKIIYTALSILFLDSFIKTTSSSTTNTTINIIDKLKEILKSIPSDYAVNDKKKDFLSSLIHEISDLNLPDIIDEWAAKQCQVNQAFKFWYFVYRHLFEPLINMYISIRSSNFNGRNSALSSMAPIFFATNHRNYARLAAQHLLDLQSCSPYLRERLERSFTVNRTNRPFSAIALDQAIECSINKFGKGRGGITGKLTPESIETWCNSFAFRSTLSSIINEIAGIEKTNNSIDGHAECSSSRMMQDEKDLSVIMKALYDENLFKMNNVHVRKIMNGKIIHEKIIENVVTMYERGLQKMNSFIQERYIDRSVKIDDRLSAMVRLRLSDPYVSSEELQSKKKKNNNASMSRIVREADNQIKNIISLSDFRELDLDYLFSHEFASSSLSLCDSQNCNFLNQQQKSEIMKFFEKQFPTGFSSINPTIDKGTWALIIDGGPLLESRPLKSNGTIFDYAKQLLLNNIIPEFKNYHRIDIIFDSNQSKLIKSFTKRHGNDSKIQQQYDLKPNDVLNSSKFHEFVHGNRAKLASVVRSCWSRNELVQLLPIDKRLFIAGPQQEVIKLVNNKNLPSVPSLTISHTLQSDQIEADTRLFLHIYDIPLDQDNKFDGVIIQSSDTDIFILTIAHVKLIMLPKCYIRKFNTSSKLFTFINVKEIANSIQQKYGVIEPNVFLILHALSGCDTTSFTRNITKTNYFSTYLSDPIRFKDLILFGDTLTINNEPLAAAEQLLISCYGNSRISKSSLPQSTSSSSRKTTATTAAPHSMSLDSLRKTMAIKYNKNQTSDICTKLPPTSNSFYEHCKRAWRQVLIWKSAFDPNDVMNYCSIEDYGYQRGNDGELVIQWMTNPDLPNDISLSKCLKCTSGCQNCTCSKNNLPCTRFCGCSKDQCKNRETTRIKQPTAIITKPTTLLINKYSFDDDFDDDTHDNLHRQNQTNIDCEDDDDDDVSESSYRNYNDAGFIRSSKADCSNHGETQTNQMNKWIFSDHDYCYRRTSWSSNGFCNAEKKDLTLSPLQSSYMSNSSDYSLSPIRSNKIVKETRTFPENCNKTSISVIMSKKRKPIRSQFNQNASSHSTPSQIIPRKKRL